MKKVLTVVLAVMIGMVGMYTMHHVASGETLYASRLNDMDAQITENVGDLVKLAIVYPSGEDDTAAIQNALTTYGHVQLVAGTYNISSISMPKGSSIIGVGIATKISTNGSAYAIKCNKHCELHSFDIFGSAGVKPNLGDAIGIYITGAGGENVVISDVKIHGFSKNGLRVEDTGMAQSDSVTVQACEIYNCYTGIYTINAEYGRYVGCIVRDCSIGVSNFGGNNTFTACTIGRNGTGFNFDTVNGALNDGHGACIGCTFNHNASYAIIASGTQNGFLFDGCQIWYGKVYSNRAKGIMFTGCVFGSGDSFDIRTDTVVFTNSMFYAEPTIANAHMNGCYTFDGDLLPAQ